MDAHDRWYERRHVLAFIVFLSAFLIYSNTLDHDFAGDDPLFISKNVYVQKGIHGIQDIFTTTLLKAGLELK